jgi:hypothetical protein
MTTVAGSAYLVDDGFCALSPGVRSSDGFGAGVRITAVSASGAGRGAGDGAAAREPGPPGGSSPG